jgi:hypothetical protein
MELRAVTMGWLAVAMDWREVAMDCPTHLKL